MGVCTTILTYGLQIVHKKKLEGDLYIKTPWRRIRLGILSQFNIAWKTLLLTWPI